MKAAAMNHHHSSQARNYFMPGASLSQASSDCTLDMRLSDVFEHSSDALILADGEARISYLNPAAEQLLGLPLKNTRGHTLDKVLTLQDGVTRQPIQIGDFSSQHTPFSGAFHLLVRNGGGAIPVQYSVSLTRTGPGATGGYMIVLRNASGLQLYIDKLATQSMHDEHSRLLRRAELVKRLWRLLQETDDGETQAFMYLDLDNFKSVNDTAGYAAGDLAISQIASRLKGVVRERDTLARLGGDEFGLLLERCPAERARQRAEQLYRAVESYVLRWNGESYRLGVSIGLAIFKTRKHSLNGILAAADAACYQAKRNGGDAPHIQEIALH
jgi:diguanylate cyclase (GGDEF)-like protein/PAS domain S-box-containing protein